MAGDRPLYYWDTCLFLAWLKDEERRTGEMDGVRELVERSRRREVRIMTSALTLVEVLSSKIPVGFDTLFANLLKRITRVSMDIKVAAIAHDLRDYYSIRQAEFGNKTLSTPDAIHLATAILYRADRFIPLTNTEAIKSRVTPALGQCGWQWDDNMQTSRAKTTIRPQKTKKLKAGMRANEDQAKRFIETARQLECDEDKERFEEKLGRIAKAKPPPKSKHETNR